MRPLWWAAMSRRAPLGALVSLACCVPAVIWAKHYWAISINQAAPSNLLTITGVTAVLTVAMTLSVSTPRLWTMERTGAPLRRVLSVALTLALVVGGPQLVLLAGHVAHPRGEWSTVGANVLFLSSLGFVVSVVAGAVVAAGSVVVLYLSLAHLLQMVPSLVPFSPLAVSGADGGHWYAAVLSLVVAVVVAIRTLGMTGRLLARTM